MRENTERARRAAGSDGRDGTGNIDSRTLAGCGRSKCGLDSAVEGAAQHDLTSLGRRGPRPQRRGGQSCQYIVIDIAFTHHYEDHVTRPRHVPVRICVPRMFME